MGLILRQMVINEYDEAYVTVYEKQEGLISLFKKFGFEMWGKKSNGESVYIKTRKSHNNIIKDFPFINIERNNKYLLSIHPEYHTRMFPESKLKTERQHVIEDVSVTNTLLKTYICAMGGVKNFKYGDMVVIYMTNPNRQQSAKYNSVATTITTVVSVKHQSEFKNKEDYINHCARTSIFSVEELEEIWRTSRFPYVIELLYNFPLSKRVVRNTLIEKIGLDGSAYWGVLNLEDDHFINILKEGENNESFIID